MSLVRPLVRPVVRPLVRPPVGRGGALQRETITLLDAMDTLPPMALTAQIDRAIRREVAAGSWAKTDLLYVPAVHDQAVAPLNWPTPGTDSLTENGSLVWTAGVGYTGNGSDAYLATGVGPGTKATQNSHAFGCYVLTEQNESGVVWGTNDSVGTACAAFIRPRSSGNFQNVSANVTAKSVTVASSIGFWAASRNATPGYEAFANSATATAQSQATTAWPDTNWDILRRGGSGDQFSTATVGMVFRSSGLTTAQMAERFSIWTDFFAAVADLDFGAL